MEMRDKIEIGNYAGDDGSGWGALIKNANWDESERWKNMLDGRLTNSEMETIKLFMLALSLSLGRMKI